MLEAYQYWILLSRTAFTLHLAGVLSFVPVKKVILYCTAGLDKQMICKMFCNLTVSMQTVKKDLPVTIISQLTI